MQRPCGWRGGSCDAGARELSQAAGGEGRLSTPRPARDASRGGTPSAFHTREIAGSPPHFRDCSSYGVGMFAEGVGACWGAGREAPAACGPGAREGSKADPLK